MKYWKIVLMSFIVVAMGSTVAFAQGPVEMQSIERGKAFFNNPTAFGGTVSCASCHPDAKNLEKSGKYLKRTFTNPAGKWLKLQDAINVCIIMANKGKAIDPRSQDMRDLVHYLRWNSKESITPPPGPEYTE